VEELSIGVDIGEDEYMLGRVGNIHATDELLYLTDTQASAVRVYDTDGRYLHQPSAAGRARVRANTRAPPRVVVVDSCPRQSLVTSITHSTTRS